jgi:hypothetical protein
MLSSGQYGSDKEDLSAQRERVTEAKADFADALRALEQACREAPDLAPVAAECRALQCVLGSKAKRPPAVDTAAWAGAVSAARRTAVRSDAWDDAVRAAQGAEQRLDTAVYDLRTAGGEDG